MKLRFTKKKLSFSLKKKAEGERVDGKGKD